MSDRKLPHSVEAEQSVLGALLVDCEAASGVFQVLSQDDFYSPRHAKIFEALRRLYDQRSTVDEVLLADELERCGDSEAAGGLPYLEELIERLPIAANAEYYAEIVRQKSILRALIGKCSEVVQGVYESDQPAQEQLDQAEHLILEIGRQGTGRDFVPIQEIIDEQFERLDSSGDDERTVMTHFTDLDQKTTGLHPAELIIVAGRPSMGKTTFCMNAVLNASLDGKTIAVFSLEVSRDQLVQNLLCSFSRVDATRVRTRSLSNEDWQMLIDAAGRMRQMRIHIDDTPGLTPLSLKAKARRLNDRQRLDMIVIDYLQLMEGGGSSESRQQEISSISRALKAVAREIQVPVIAISQLSRGVESRDKTGHRPRMSDLRESGAIEQDADLILLLYRQEYYEPEKEEVRGKAEVIIAKQRNGPTGTIHLQFTPNCMRFENLAATHYAAEEF